MATKKIKEAVLGKLKKAEKVISKEEVTPSVSIRTDAKEAIVTVILDNNPNKKEQRRVKLVVVNNELVPDPNEMHPGVKSI